MTDAGSGTAPAAPPPTKHMLYPAYVMAVFGMGLLDVYAVLVPLYAVSLGLSNTEIADRLFVSPRTIEHHVSAVLAKLESSTRQQAVTRARADGLLP